MRPNHDVIYFTKGYCYALAKEIHTLTGFGLRVLSIGLHEHVLVKLPDGQFLDVRGVQSRELIERLWGVGRLRAVGPGHLNDKDWGQSARQNFGPLDVNRTRRVARWLVRNIVTLKCTKCPAMKIVNRERCFYSFKEIETLCPKCQPKKKKKSQRSAAKRKRSASSTR